MTRPSEPRRLLTAQLLSIGSELTVGETRDTNAGEIAASLTGAGVTVTRMSALPDRLDVVAEAIATALERVDLVVSTGGLGPTPDDLTREAIAAVLGEEPAVDPELETWLRGLWARRELPFPESNRKQAWRIPSAIALPNPHGTAPGWLVRRPIDDRVIVALPALQARGLGADVASRTFRLTGIGESQVAEILGEPLLRRSNPEVATYARVEAVDVRVSAIGDATGDAETLVAGAAAIVQERLGQHVWATGAMTWSDAIGERLAALGWRLAVVEIGTGGQVGALLGDVDWLVFDESTTADGGVAQPDADQGVDADADDTTIAHARRARERSGAQVGLAVRTRERDGDTAVSIAVATPEREHVERRLAFLGGRLGRTRAALVAAAVLLATLPGTDPET